MKTEEFDDAIKRKVEGVNHKFTENDVERVHKFVTANRGPLWLRGSFRKLFIYSATGLLLTGIITWQLTKMHDQEILNQTIESLKKDYNKNDVITSKQNNNSAQKNNNKALSDNNLQNSTIDQNSQSTNKNVDQKLNAQNISRNYNSQQSINDTKSQQSVNQKSNSTIATFIRRKSNSKQFASNDNLINHSNKDISNFSAGLNNTDNKKAIPKPNGGDQQNSQNKIDLNQKNDQLANNDKLGNNQNNRNTSNTSNSSQNNLIDTKIADEKTNSTLKIEEKSTAQKKVADSLMSPKTYRGPKYDKDPSKNPVNIRFQAGLGAIEGFDAVNHLAGGQISGEILINNRFSLSTGVNIITLNSKKFESDTDFSDDCKGKDFYRNELHIYSPWTNEYANSNITIQELLVQVPINISYYSPFRNHWAFSVSAGTDIDIYSHQTLLYDQTKQWSNKSVFCHIEQKNTIVPFNNVTGSVGILKQLGRLAIQFSPYISYQLTPVDYKLENIYYGANLRFLLSFGKGGF